MSCAKKDRGSSPFADAPPEVREIMEKLARGETPPEPSPEVTKWMEKQAGAASSAGSPDFAPLLTCLAKSDFGAAHAWLHPKLAEAWPEERFTSDVASVRNGIGEAWSPERTGWFTRASAQGPVHSVGYSLVRERWGDYTLELVARKIEGEHRVVQWTMTMPGGGTDKGLAAARSVARTFLDKIRSRQDTSAFAMMTSQLRGQVNAALLNQIRQMFWSKAEGPLAFSGASQRKLINGQWYVSVIAYPSDLPASHIEMLLLARDTDTLVASIGFKAKARP
jgi:hypothetical protein